MTQTTILYWHRQKPSTQVKIGNPFLHKRKYLYEGGGEGGTGNCLIPKTTLFHEHKTKFSCGVGIGKAKPLAL